jgi:hypothetical protein
MNKTKKIQVYDKITIFVFIIITPFLSNCTQDEYSALGKLFQGNRKSKRRFYSVAFALQFVPSFEMEGIH